MTTAFPKRCSSKLKESSGEIGKGHHLVLLGHNGAGKTSLLRVMAGICPPSEGVVLGRGSVGCLIEMATGLSAEMTGYESIKHQALLNGGEGQDWRDVAADIAEFTELGSYLDQQIGRASCRERVCPYG